ncbi:MAG: cytochrome b N-terminal domain-containing protein, partial [Proteobacteria bacterium]|nr:cytochrome b N-terminal domain-containing protein [Pseudomonadota bacterium]
MATKTEFNNPVIRWVDERLPIFSYLDHEYNQFPMPKNLNYWWNFGALASVALVMMIVTGIMLAMQYTAHVDMAFESVERIMRDVNYGWLLRYIHMNGASMFFIVVYIHLFRGLYYGSYKNPRELLWMLGVVIILLMMATSFLGYVLPWGQMSLWGATVITNMFSAIPLVGDWIVTWLWGGFSVDNPTLNRFYALHYLMPFILFAVVGLHVVAVHVTGSSNPTGIEVQSPRDTVSFHPYFTAKDSVGLVVFLIVFATLVFFAPNILGEPDNYIKADPLVTPPHIVPEWYFLPFYAILRAVPDNFIGGWLTNWAGFTFISAKLAGVIAMFAATLVLFIVPWLDTSKVRSARYRPVYRWVFLVFLLDCLFLGWLGMKPAEGDFIILGQLGTVIYFGFFFIAMPLLGWLETPKPLPTSISEPVLK